MLTSSFKRELKKRCHALSPVVMIGANGLTEAVLKEIDSSLNAHELLKIRLSGADKEARTQMIDTIANELSAEVIQTIGHTAAFYREREDS